MTAPSYLDAIGAHARTRPDTTAVVDADGETGYGALWDEARRMAGLLRAQGVSAGDVVAVWLPNSRRWTEAFLAVSLLGAATLAVNTSFNSHEVADLLDRSRSTVLVTTASHRNRNLVDIVRGMQHSRLVHLSCVVVDRAADATCRRLQDELGRPVVDLDAPATLVEPAPPAEQLGRPAVIFTSSGTTGAPKLIVHTQFDLSGHVDQVAHVYRMTEPSTVVMAPLPFCGVMGLETMLSALVAGTTVTTLPSFDAAGAIAQIRRYEVTTFACSDEALRRIMAQAGPGELASLRDVALAVFGGNAGELVRQARQLGFRAFQTYGSSEVHALLCYPPDGVPDEELALGGGYPVSPAYRVRARDGSAELPDGERGSLEVLSPYLFAGYLEGNDLRRPLTSDGYFRTGDLAYTVEGGFVYLARESDALRLGGFLVEPREIESFVETLPGVDAAQVVGIERGGRTRTVAFVVGDDRIDEAEVVERCRTELATFKVPAAVVRLPEFPTTVGPNGVKIRRVDLRTRAEELLGEGTAQ